MLRLVGIAFELLLIMTQQFSEASHKRAGVGKQRAVVGGTLHFVSPDHGVGDDATGSGAIAPRFVSPSAAAAAAAAHKGHGVGK